MPRDNGEPRLRIVVHVGGASPELARALASTPARARAERLRQLALLGLVALRAPDVAVAPRTVAEPVTASVDARRQRVLGVLRAGLIEGSTP
jgi:hypothetical protein